jgi:hypothetical protein
VVFATGVSEKQQFLNEVDGETNGAMKLVA